MLELLAIIIIIVGILVIAQVLLPTWANRFRWAARRLPLPNPETLKPQIEMVGREALVITPLGQGYKGTVKVEGELWAARLLARDGADYPAELEAGARVRIVEQQDLLLLVEPLSDLRPRGWQTPPTLPQTDQTDLSDYNNWKFKL